MSVSLEAKLKEEVKAFLKDLAPDLWFYMHVPMGYGIRGIPDFVGLYKGMFFVIETKAPGKTLSPWQARVRDYIVEAGGYHIEASLFQDVKVQITKFMELRNARASKF